MRRRGHRAFLVLFGFVAVAPFVLGVASAESTPAPAPPAPAASGALPALNPPGPTPEAREEDEAVPDDSAGGEPLPGPPAPEASAGAAAEALARGGMVRVPGMTFTMGSSDPKSPTNERPRHLENVHAFWLDRTEVTVEAYRACVDSHACAPPTRSSNWCTYEKGDPRLPVSCVHWKDAEAYCRAQGKRLPREAEWELAARGQKGARFPWRTAASGCYYAATMVNDSTGRSCTKGPSRVGAHPAGATPLGILDLAGNVEEWTQDWYVENLAEGAAPAAGASHVLRGGGWQSGPAQARTSARNWGSSVEAGPNVGFRCAKDD